LKAHFVNGKNISHIYQNAISNAGNFTLLQPKFFSSLSDSNLNISGLINGINLTNLENGSMKLAGAQVVTGRVTFLN
jgi:curli biogenesis system outer membrane secretion channel CsgG